jgi:hypothetical protein
MQAKLLQNKEKMCALQGARLPLENGIDPGSQHLVEYLNLGLRDG